MRICLVYDCLFPWTMGGHERFMRGLAERLAAQAHDVTYVTRRQWDTGAEPDLPGVTVEAVAREEPLYDAAGRRRIGQALRFGLGTFRFFRRNRGSFDVVHVVAFPYFSVPAARLALAGSGTRVVVDWPEVWTRRYWREYLGARWLAGYMVQRLCVRLSAGALVYSELHGERLAREGVRGEATRVPGPVAWEIEAHPAPVPATPLVLFVGRLIPEKRAVLVVEAIAAVRERLPGVRAVIAGDGPEHGRVCEAIGALGLEGCVSAPGFMAAEELAAAFERATCLVAPSAREGFGIVALEANAAGTPVIAVSGPDNAMTERIVDGVNGTVVASAGAGPIADAIVDAHEAGQPLRDTTAAHFTALRAELSAERVTDAVLGAYRAASP